MSADDLATGLTTVQIQPNKSKPPITSYKPPKTASNFRGALIRDIYNKIFDFIVQTTSAILSGGENKNLAKTSEGYVFGRALTATAWTLALTSYVLCLDT